MAPTRSEVRSAFRLHGFSLRPDAAAHLESVLAPLDDDDGREWTDRIVAALQAANLDSAVVSRDAVVAAVKSCSSEEAGGGAADEEELIFNVVDAFDVPRFTYSQERKKYVPDSVMGKPAPSIYPADARSKANMFNSRYELLHQRTSRHDLFTPVAAAAGSAVAGGANKKKYKLKTVECLLSTTSRQDDAIALGMLAQVSHGTYSLEDPTGAVPLDLTEAKFHRGLYTENCFVLVEGWCEDGVFHVAAMGFPPAESAETTRAYFGAVNFFGGPSDTCAARTPRLQRMERENPDAMFVFLSDVWLDRADVLDGLKRLLAGYTAVPPTCFVLMGNFLSSPYGSRQAAVLKEKLKALGELMADFPEVCDHSKFLFVPGPSDPGFANVLPRPALPSHLTEDLRRRVPSARFVSNPCRVQFCTREIVVFREDVVTKMCRNCIYFPESGDIPSHFARTLACQAHVAPLPPPVCPVYWDFDSSLRLYPLPDLVVTGDKFDPFSASESGCAVINPGSFGKNDFSFKTFVPKTGEVEDCQLPSQD